MLPAFQNIRKSFLTMLTGQVFIVILSIIKVKLLAIMLGTSGIGIFSILQNLKEIVTQTTNVGLSSSGVRFIAKERANSNRILELFHTIIITNILLGLLGCLPLIFVSASISNILFNTPSYDKLISIIAVATFFFQLSATYSTLLQGLRKIKLFSAMTWLPVLISTVVGTLCVYLLGVPGMAYFFITQAVISVALGIKFKKNMNLEGHLKLSLRRYFQLIYPMILLGLTFMFGGLINMCVLFLLRIYISDSYGLSSLGEFSAAWAITTTYLGVFLTALSADYFPRLAAAADDRQKLTENINQQITFTLVFGTPVLILLFFMSPFVVPILYTNEFRGTALMVQLCNLGNFFKLISWSIGFVFAATGLGKIFLLVQVTFNVIFVASFVIFQHYFQLMAVGYAFSFAYLAHALIVYMVAHKTRQINLFKSTKILIFINLIIILYQYGGPGIQVSDQSLHHFIVLIFCFLINASAAQYFGIWDIFKLKKVLF